MFTTIRWEVEPSALMVRIVGTAPIMPIRFLAQEIERLLIGNMVNILECAEKFKGKPIDILPDNPKYNDSIIATTTIVFDSSENKIAFLKEFKNVIK